MSLKCPASSWNREVLSVFLAAWISREQRGIARRRGQGASHLSRAHIMPPLAALQMTLSLSSCLWASSWLTYHSTSPLLPGLRCSSLPSGTDLQGMPLDTCHPGPSWHGPKTSHKHHEQSQTPGSLSPGSPAHSLPTPGSRIILPATDMLP